MVDVPWRTVSLPECTLQETITYPSWGKPEHHRLKNAGFDGICDRLWEGSKGLSWQLLGPLLNVKLLVGYM